MAHALTRDEHMKFDTLRKMLFVFLLTMCSTQWVDAVLALAMGILFSLIFGNPWPQKTAHYSRVLLQLSVVGLGFGLSLGEVLHTGKSSMVYSVIGIACTLLLGYSLGLLFRTDKNTSALISFGTAICGGSAIAAMSPVLKATDDETAVALATVFTLNAVALLLFPLIGHCLQLDQNTFGVWSGLAIHDTSSVVGATSAYGPMALTVGTTVKLTRAVWIAPIVMISSFLKGGEQKIEIPLFIVGFMVAATIRTLLPMYEVYWGELTVIARQCLDITLFMVGVGLSREMLRSVGIRPFSQAVVLWAMVSALSLFALKVFGLA